MLLPHIHRSPRVILAVVLLAQLSTPLPVFSLGALAPLLRDALHLSQEQYGGGRLWVYRSAHLCRWLLCWPFTML